MYPDERQKYTGSRDKRGCTLRNQLCRVLWLTRQSSGAMITHRFLVSVTLGDTE